MKYIKLWEGESVDAGMISRIQASVNRDFRSIITQPETRRLLDSIRSNSKIGIDPYVIIGKIQAWILGSIPSEISKMKLGTGGEYWAERLESAIKAAIAEETSAALTIPKKLLVKGYYAFSGGQSGFVKDTVNTAMQNPHAEEGTFTYYLEELESIINRISQAARLKPGTSDELPEMVAWSKKISAWSDSAWNYFEREQRAILTGTVKSISDLIWE